MPTPNRSCRWCGSDHFVQTGMVEWNVRAPSGDLRHTRAVTGTMVACAGCGLVETFLDDPLDLANLPEANEVRVPGGGNGGYREQLPSGESPAGTGWQVVLVHAGEQPIGVISELRKELPMSFASARESISRLPWVLTRTSNRRVADHLSEKLAELGALVRIEPTQL
jgi:ribosomal protein L7/L12